MSMLSPAQGKLAEIIRSVSYKEGSFVLSSGKQSSFYVDLKQTTLHPEGASLIAELVWSKLNPRNFGGVGGPTLGADPLASTLSLAAWSQGVFLPAYIIRKEPKKHGTSQWIEGRENLKSGSELLVVEDVVTTGGSSITGIEKLRAEGFVVKHIVAVLDRNEGANKRLEEIGVSLLSLLTIQDLKKGGIA